MSTKIKSIYVKHLRAIYEQKLDLNGCTAIVIGGNNKGKTTLTRALIDRFRGIKAEHIVNESHREGLYSMEFTTGERVEWKINQLGKESLFYYPGDGGEYREKVTSGMMQHYFPAGFDVDKFLNDAPAKQRKTLEKLSGLDFSEADKSYKIAYENRAYYNKRLAEEQAKQVKFEPNWLNECRETLKIEQELEDINAHNLRYQTVESKLKEKEILHAKVLEEIECLKRQIELKLESGVQLEMEIVKGKAWLQDETRKPKNEEHKQKLKDQLKDIEKNNDAVKELQTLLNFEKYARDADNEVKKIIADKEEMVRLADLPVGFGFNEEGVTYNNLPFNKQSQSTSALYIAALKLAALTIGEVKAIHFDASYLDKNNLEQVMEWAENNNLQLLIERPDIEGCGEIRYEIIED